MSWHEALVNLIHREVLRVTHRNTRRTPVIVDSYDPQTYASKFKLMPDSIDTAVVTGWIPHHTLQTGNGYGWHAPPNIGDHGWLDFHEDDREGGTFTAATFNDQLKPLPTQAGELQHQSIWGHVFYIKNDGSFTIKNGKKSGTGGTAQKPPTGTSKQSTILLDPQGNITKTAPTNIVANAGGDINDTASGNINEKASGTINNTATGAVNITSSGATVTVAGANQVVIAAPVIPLDGNVIIG